MKKRHARIENWDDERSIGNGLIVTLCYGWSFEAGSHEGVQGFDTVKEAMEAVRSSHPCKCEGCKAENA